MKKIDLKTNYLYFSYIVFLVSLFMGDISMFQESAKFLKAIILISNIIYLLKSIMFDKKNSPNVNKLSLFLIISFFVIFAISKDFYWLILITYFSIFQLKKYDDEKIIKVALITILSLSIMTIIFCLIGFLPDYITYRSDVNSIARHSFGFYHSNVLPIIYFYLLIFYLIIKNMRKEKLNKFFYLIAIIVSFLLYYLCNSKNSFLLSLVLIMVTYFKNFNLNGFLKKTISFVSKNIFIILFVTTFFATLFYYNNILNELWILIDKYYTNRLYLQKIVFGLNGIHIFNFNYFNGINDYVLDNGFAYLIFRYGLFIVGPYICINNVLWKKYKKNMYMLLLIIFVSLSNFVDNDLLSYNFLPFVFLVFNSVEKISVVEE